MLVDSTKICHIASVKHEYQNFNLLMDQYRNGLGTLYFSGLLLERETIDDTTQMIPVTLVTIEPTDHRDWTNEKKGLEELRNYSKAFCGV